MKIFQKHSLNFTYLKSIVQTRLLRHMLQQLLDPLFETYCFLFDSKPNITILFKCGIYTHKIKYAIHGLHTTVYQRFCTKFILSVCEIG